MEKMVFCSFLMYFSALNLFFFSHCITCLSSHVLTSLFFFCVNDLDYLCSFFYIFVPIHSFKENTNPPKSITTHGLSNL